MQVGPTGADQNEAAEAQFGGRGQGTHLAPPSAGPCVRSHAA